MPWDETQRAALEAARTANTALEHVFDCEICHESFPCDVMEESIREARQANRRLDEQLGGDTPDELRHLRVKLGALIDRWIEETRMSLSLMLGTAPSVKSIPPLIEEAFNDERHAKFDVEQMVRFLAAKLIQYREAERLRADGATRDRLTALTPQEPMPVAPPIAPGYPARGTKGGKPRKK